MDPATHERLRDAAFRRFADALRAGAAPDRDAFLAGLPEALREDVGAMIAELADITDESSEPAPVLEPGAIFGEFELIEPLGTGGAGVVWLARQPSLGRRVALKFLKSQLVVSPTAMERFRREAHAAARLSHTGVVQVYASGARGGIPYLALELVEGQGTLLDWLEARRALRELPSGYYRDVADVFRSIADALAHAHERGVVHRDVKPSNVLIDADGRPKVADFGTAMLEEELHLTRTGDFFGTPFYMSPEQAASRRMGIDHRTDVFSLGATLYEALSLTRAFDGDTSVQVFTKILTVDPPDPRTLRSQVPRDLAVICMKALEKTPQDRYADMRVLRDDLGAFLEGRAITARPPTLVQRARRKIRRHPRLATAAGVALACTVPILFLWTGRAEARASESHAIEQREALETRDEVVGRSDTLLREAQQLWPLTAENLPALEDWLERALALTTARESLGADLADLARGTDPADLPTAGRRVDALRASLAVEPDAALFESRLRTALANIDLFDAEGDELRRGSSARFGMGIEERARILRAALEQHASEASSAAWEGVRARVRADARFAGLVLAGDYRLTPLGPDPGSGLEEFAHLLTGAVPERDPLTGRLAMTPDCGLVFVLVPGGEQRIGGQGDDEQAERHVEGFESTRDLRLIEVELDPFLISKYEAHRAAYARIMGVDPSKNDRMAERAMPVERVSYATIRPFLSRAGLGLPTQAQWEVAARAGTDGRWAFAPDVESSTYANIAGIEARDAGKDWLGEGEWRPVSDGYVLSAPIDALQPNRFGLHHVHGNLFELCRDVYVEPGTPLEPPARGDGLLRPRNAPASTSFVQRGGFYGSTLQRARITYLGHIDEHSSNNAAGFRPIHPLVSSGHDR